MQNSEVEYKKTKSEPLAARPASTAVLWGCVGGRLTVCQSICPSVRSSPLARAVRGWRTMAKAHTMSHSVRNAAPTCERAQTQRGKRRVARNEQVCALVPSLPMHRTESERAYILGPTRVRRKEDPPVLHATPLQPQHSRIGNDSMNSRY